VIADLERVEPPVVILPTGPSWDGIADTVRHYRISRAVLIDYVPAEVQPDGIALVPRETGITPPAADYFSAAACDWGFAGGFLDLDMAEPEAWPAETVPVQAQVDLRGWLANPATGAAAVRGEVTVDGTVIGRFPLTVRRPDVASHLDSPAAALSGFWTLVTVAEGEAERMRVWGVYADGSRLAVDQSGGAIDLQELRDLGEVRRLAPVDADRLAETGLILDGGEAGRVYALSDIPPWEAPDPHRVIRIGSPRGETVRIPLSACPQLWAMAGKPLYLWAEDGRIGADLAIVRARW